MASNNLIVGCSSDFDFSEQIKAAKSIKIAMAFAKGSGWKLLQHSLLSQAKIVEIVVGLNFGITDADLLEEWLALCSEMPSRFIVRVADKSPTFHPKVVLARFHDGSGLGIVGSGNLTAGGQMRNIECGALIRKSSEIEQLERWFESLKAVRLTQQIIDEYRPLDRRAKEQERQLDGSGERARLLRVDKCDWRCDELIADFAAFLNSKTGKKSLRSRIGGAQRIRTALNMPHLNFDRNGFSEFYRIPEFGRIRKAYPEMAQKPRALRQAFHFLIAKPLDADRLRAVLNRRDQYHVVGLGMNQISKVLTVFKRNYWPLLNSPVRKTLGYYGYMIGFGAEDYLRFAEEMRICLGEMGNVDFWAFDAFCEKASHNL